jgi:5'-nucleotidase
MDNRNGIAKIAVIALLLVAGIFTTEEVYAQKKLTIIHSNDTHSCIYPMNKNLADTMLANRGGFLRRINMIKEQRQEDPELLLIDSGDFSQGSAYYSMFKGDVEIDLMNMMKYDAATIGNHEFDFGLDNMVRLFKKANFPIVCSNYDFANTELANIVKPYTIIKRKGLKIGIFALCPPLEGLVATQNYGAIKFLDPIECTNKMVAILKDKKKCDLVICLSHMGWAESEYTDEMVLRQIKDCDLVLGGHTHTYMPVLQYASDKTGKQIPVDQNGKHGAFVGRLVLQLSRR